ncbi:fimbria/pilus outer membrane usher protein [Enterobacter sp. MGH 16]|uniref:fimbria/pilus outer membrane usher protein n=1 Tax=Enterobacter cloacae complex TaxID=354276 RepID=UPI0003BF19D9|nr:fimbria/pilus outer membrane usher protein [Enterobacter sp. MGH 16]ESN53167.1 hypothetical protein L362_00064 [Enterobacter sp. MGH 16]
METLKFSYSYSFLFLSIATALFSGASLPVYAEAASLGDAEFESSFLKMGDRNAIDLSRFSMGGSALPGTYNTQIWLNNEMVVQADVTFITRPDRTVVPCLTPALLAQLPLDSSKMKDGALSGECVELSAIIPDSRVSYDSSEQVLSIDVPQVWVSKAARGTVSADLWDSGIPAALLSYGMNGYSSESNGKNYRSFYTNLNGGVNIGSWYMRHNGNWSWSSLNGGHYQSINTYLQRDLPQIKGRVLLGQSNTSGAVFDTLPFTGAQLMSDERMEPLSRRGYAPEIRGIARTNAQVSISQNGALIYETTVSPGAFVISDLYPTGYGGDLDVTVREADGSEQHFQVPYSAVTQQLRPGVSRYEFTAGRLHTSYLRNNPELFEGSWRYGLNNWLTIYGGLQGSQHYAAGQGGAAFGTPFGSVSLDITHAKAELGVQQSGNATSSGESYRLSYSKNIAETGSNFSLAAYRFSTSGYLDFMTAMQTRDAISDGEEANNIRRTKNRFTLTATQNLPESWGQFYVSTSVQDYWNSEGRDKQYQFGYSNFWKRLSYGISASRSYSATGTAQDTVMLNFSLPLGESYRAPQGRLSYTNGSNGRDSWQASVSGTSGEDNQFSYGVTGTTANQGVGSSGSLNGQYRTRVSTLNAGYNTGSHYSSLSAGMSGTVIGHAGGLTLSPYQGDTFALVEAKGLEGARVNNYSGIRIDGNGYAAVPYLTPYQFNEIAIDPKDTDINIELESTSRKVAPRDKSIVKVSYNTRKGTPVLITASQNGEPLPFGAEVLDSQGKLVGYVGQGGQIYARVEKDADTLTATWSGAGEQKCKVSYRLIPMDKSVKAQALQQFTSICHR